MTVDEKAEKLARRAKNQRYTRARHRATGLCAQCKEPVEPDYSTCAKHRHKGRESQAKFYAKHRDRILAKRRGDTV